ncbi:MAG: baeRF3 domain-containing protein [Phycisphaerales bacterium]
MLTREQLHELAAVRGKNLVSIFLPTHRASREIRQDPIRFKNLCTQAEERLQAHGVRRDDAAAILEPASDLLDDREFWRNQGEGLAVYLNDGPMRTHRVATSLDEHVFVGDRFAVRPLVAAAEDATSFFVLAIHQNSVRLLHCTRDGARTVDSHDIPRSLADAVGYDWEQESLQFHTRAQKVGSESSHGAATDVGQRTGVNRAAVYHGQGGEGDADVKQREAQQFLHRVDEGLSRLLGARPAPVVLAAAEPIDSMFRNIAKTSSLLDDGIEGNTEHLSVDDLHKRAIKVMEPRFKAPEREALDRFVEVKTSDRAVEGVHDVLAALREGRVEVLLADPRASVWGAPKDDPNSQDSERGDDLLDLAVHQAISTGARVFPFDDRDAPTDKKVAAVLRY